MPSFLETVAARLAVVRDRIFVGGRAFGPLPIDRGRGMLYDVERNITWLSRLEERLRMA